jgi:hypothetical protein
MTTRPSGGRIANRKSPTITDRTYRAPPGTTVPSTRPPLSVGRWKVPDQRVEPSRMVFEH